MRVSGGKTTLLKVRKKAKNEYPINSFKNGNNLLGNW